MAKAKTTKLYRVFLSYAHKDRWIAKQMVGLIEREAVGRVHVFLDAKDIEIGERIEEEVLEAIRSCDEFVVLLSVNSKDRPWVLC